MAYINLKDVTAPSNMFFRLCIEKREFKLGARKDLITSIQIWGFVYNNVILSAGDVMKIKEGDHRCLVVNYEGLVVKEVPASAAQVEGSESGIEYQKYNPGEEFVVVPRLYRWRGVLKEIVFELYPNNGKLKPGLDTQTFAVERDGNSRTELVALLKFAHKKGGSAVTMNESGIEIFVSGVGPVPLKKKRTKEVLEIWNQIQGCESLTDEEVLCQFNIFLY